MYHMQNSLPATEQILKAFREFTEDCRDPKQAQARVWSEIKNQIEAGPFWQKHFAAGKSTYHDFDITTFKDYQDAFDMAFQTGRSPLTLEKVDFFGETSGTSGAPKRLPITESYMRQRLRTQVLSHYRWLSQFPSYLAGRPLALAAGGYKLSPTGVPSGFFSTYFTKFIPSAVPIQIFETETNRADWLIPYALAANVGSIQAVTPFKLTSFLGLLKSQLRESLPYLNGTKPTPSFLPPLKISADRLKVIEQMVSDGRVSLRKIWPNFRFVTCFMTGPCSLQVPSLKEEIDDETIAIGDYGYSSTEALMGAPVSQSMNGLGSCLNPNSHVFEFIEENAPFTKENLIPLWELETGKFYELFLTTAMGYIRYRLEDIIECTGRFENVSVVRFVRKAGEQFQVGVIRVTEAAIVATLKEVAISSQGDWCFGPNREGTKAVLYHNEPDITDENLRLFEAKLREIDSTFNKDVRHPIERVLLPKSHSVWQKRNHVQSKLRLLIKQVPT